jgi:RNA polymerase sigma factor (sigma-70 family)
VKSTVANRTERTGGSPKQSPAVNDGRVTGTGHLSDGELIRRFVDAQDEAAFREIVRRYTPLLMGVALRTTHDRQAAEDVLQATLLVLIEKADSLDDPTQVAAWLHGVAMRIARRLVDKRHRQREQLQRHENLVMAPAETTDPFEQVCETRDHDVLGEELQRLPEKYRTPMVLRYLEDLSNEQVAERLGMTVPAIEGRLKRGKKELRRRLARRGVTLGAAMLVWNMTQQAVAAAPVASLADVAATTALAWQTPTPVLAPPSESAISLAQQEMALMSTLKLTTAGTLAGTLLLAAGLLVAMTGMDEGVSPAVASPPTRRALIDTAASNAVGTAAVERVTQTDEAASADATVTEQGGEESSAAGNASAPADRGESSAAANNPTHIVEVFQLQYVDAELAQRMLSGFFEGVTDETDERRIQVIADAATNRVIVRGEQSAQELTKAILQKLDELAERDRLELGASAGETDATDPDIVPATTANDNDVPANSSERTDDHQLPVQSPHGTIRQVDQSNGTVWISLGTDDGLRTHVAFGVYDEFPGLYAVNDGRS